MTDNSNRYHVIYTEEGLDIAPIKMPSYDYSWPKWYQTSTVLYVGLLIFNAIFLAMIILAGG